MNFRPLANNVVIKRNAPSVGENLIVLPEAVKARLAAESMRGTVLAIGPGHKMTCPWCEEDTSVDCAQCNNTREVTIPVEGFNVGDEVVFLVKAGEDEVIDGQTLFFIKSWSIVAVVDKAGNFKPLQDRILVRRREAATKTRWGLIIPDIAIEQPTDGTVVAVGPGLRVRDGRLHANTIRPGDRVAFKRYEAEIEVGGEKLVLLSEGPFGGGTVIAVLPPGVEMSVQQDVAAEAKREKWAL